MQQAFADVATPLDRGKIPQQVLAELGSDDPAPDTFLDSFRGAFDQLVGFIRQNQLIRLSADVRPVVEETPPFLRAVTFVSMDTPEPYETLARESYFNVTVPESD